jgi:hypothetical protein
MRTREEYEKICEKTFGLVGDAQATRMQIDLLLDIRELLIWTRDREMLKDVVDARLSATIQRINSIVEK